MEEILAVLAAALLVAVLGYWGLTLIFLICFLRSLQHGNT